MRKPILLTAFLALLCLFTAAQSTRAAVLYGESAVGYDSSSRYVYGYGMTWTDYELALYYDPEVYTVLLQYETALDSGSNVGYSDPYWGYQIAAEYDTFSWYYWPSTTYATASHHKVRPYYNNGYGYWFDPFNFYGFAPGTYGGYWGFYGYPYNPYNYIPVPVVHPFNTFVEITTPPDATPTPTPTPTPNPTPAPCNLRLELNATSANPDPGNINGTSQTALLGGIITLYARALNADGDEVAGSYTWSASNGGQISEPIPGSGLQQYRNVYWTTEGTGRATVVFTPGGGGCQVTGYVDVTSVVPTQFTYSATQKNGSIRSDCNSGQLNEFSGDAFSLGCGFRDPGITFSASLQAPMPFISAANDSKIKLVQYVSSFYTATDPNGYLCAGERLSESNVESGWRLDGADPYPGGTAYGAFDPNTGVARVYPYSPPAHPEGVADSPGVGVDNPFKLTYLRFDLQFEMYLVYVAGDPAAPRVQRPIAIIPWNFGGEANFSPPGVWSNYVSYPQAQTRTGVPTATMRSAPPVFGGNFTRCSGPTPEPTPPPDPDPDPDPCYSGYRFCQPIDQY